MAVQTAPLQTIYRHTGYMRAKRIFDLVFTLLFLLPLLFVMAIVALAIMLDSEGPVFFRQKRVGGDGKEFYLLKFRSMYHNTSDGRHREAIKVYMNGGALNGYSEAQYKLGNDDRITRVGRFIRKTSIDELPQFFNVLRGDMSLVGPRPDVPNGVELYSEHDRLRLSGKPGLTGIWQVYGRSRVPFKEMVEMDIAYLQQQSLWQDLKLVVLTIPVVVLGRGGA
jgi:lipopolysaccharide/colanic/teichoic acid biosynthesis glycosyltransferase